MLSFLLLSAVSTFDLLLLSLYIDEKNEKKKFIQRQSRAKKNTHTRTNIISVTSSTMLWLDIYYRNARDNFIFLLLGPVIISLSFSLPSLSLSLALHTNSARSIGEIDRWLFFRRSLDSGGDGGLFVRSSFFLLFTSVFFFFFFLLHLKNG